MNKPNLRPSSPHASERGRTYTDLTAGSKVTLGIYVSRDKMFVSLVKKEFTGFTVKGVYNTKIPDKFYRDKAVAVDFLKNFLTDIVKMSENVDVWCNARVEKVVVARQLLDSVEDDCLNDLVMWNFRKSSGMNPELYICDYEVLEGVEDNKSRMAVNIYSLPRQEMNYMVDVFKSAGFPLLGLTLPRSGYSNLHSAKYFPQFSTFACNIFIGERGSSILIYHEDKVIVSREVKFGFYDLSEALSGHFDNEVLDRLDSPDVLKFIDKQLYEIIDKASHTLDFFYANYRGCDIDNFFISGLVVDHPILVKLLEKRLGVELSVLAPLVAKGIETSTDIGEKDSYLDTSIAIGISSNSHAVNFLFTQLDKFTLVKMIKKAKLARALFLVLLLIFGVLFFNLFEKDSFLQKELSATENQLAGFKPYKTVPQLENRNSRLAKLKEVIEESTAKASMLQAVNDISRVLPAEVYVTALNLNKASTRSQDGEFTNFTSLTLRGAIYSADDELSRRKVGELMLALEGLDIFEEVKRSVKKVSTKVGDESGKFDFFDFSLDMKISGELSQQL